MTIEGSTGAQCEAREDYYRRQNDVKRYIQKQDDTIRQQSEQIQQQTEQIRQQAEQIQLLTATINDLQKKLQNSRSNDICQHSPQEFYRKWMEDDKNLY